jgi:hypothetical protein
MNREDHGGTKNHKHSVVFFVLFVNFVVNRQWEELRLR